LWWFAIEFVGIRFGACAARALPIAYDVLSATLFVVGSLCLSMASAVRPRRDGAIADASARAKNTQRKKKSAPQKARLQHP
jgi:hypothetical protein